MVYTRVEPGRLVEFAPQSRLVRLLLPRMRFRIEPSPGDAGGGAGDEGSGCRVVQEIHIRIGPLGARLNRKELDAVRRHMKEEGDNMKRLLEAGPSPSP